MSTININFTKQNGNVLDASDLDVFGNEIETLLNTNKLTAENFADESILASNVTPEAFNQAQLRRRLNAYELYALGASTVADNSLSTSLADDSLPYSLVESRSTSNSNVGHITVLAGSTTVLSGTTSTSIFTSESFTCGGRLVEISITAQPNGSPSSFGFTTEVSGTTEEAEMVVELYRDESLIQAQRSRYEYTHNSAGVALSFKAPPTYRFYDDPGEGEFTYEVRFRRVTGTSLTLENLQQVVREV